MAETINHLKAVQQATANPAVKIRAHYNRERPRTEVDRDETDLPWFGTVAPMGVVTVGEQRTITADAFGNPIGGLLDNPWPAGHPAAGERVAIFADEVTRVDENAEDMRRYHVAPAACAREGPIGSPRGEEQGITVQWVGCGTGTVVRPIGEQSGERICEVLPDDPRII
jgi:hypothetical protein